MLQILLCENPIKRQKVIGKVQQLVRNEKVFSDLSSCQNQFVQL